MRYGRAGRHACRRLSKIAYELAGARDDGFLGSGLGRAEGRFHAKTQRTRRGTGNVGLRLGGDEEAVDHGLDGFWG